MPSSTHPLLIWPFVRPRAPEHIAVLTKALMPFGGEGSLVFVNECSREWIANSYAQDLDRLRDAGWTIRWIRSVDTCQTWLTAFATSHAACSPHQSADRCLHTLVPGDFHYAAAEPTLIEHYVTEAASVAHQGAHMHLGQIQSPRHTFKSAIDEFGTWPLLRVWFPGATAMLEKRLEHPRSEFLSLTGQYLSQALCERWLPYEQTLILLLRECSRASLDAVAVTSLGPLTEDAPASPLVEASTQLERMDRALRVHWREVNSAEWRQRYESLSAASAETLRTNLRTLSKVLTSHPAGPE